jgi:hypothetical protein
MQSPIDRYIGFKAYDWSSRLGQVTTLAETDLTRRGFEVKHVRLYEGAAVSETSSITLALAWDVSSPC